jgi:deoxyadenosine/deoxycytidine kinase
MRPIANTMSIMWDVDPSTTPGPHRGIYVAISGNTGAGKSSLIEDVVAQGAKRGIVVRGVSERTFHHPLLRLMFADPVGYAFGVQLNFMLQRALFLRRHLELGHSLIIERSHLDDDMFVREHLRAGNISRAQYMAYREVAAILHRDLQVPDIVVMLKVTAADSLRRVVEDEMNGVRPVEFPSQAAKRLWVERWHDLYGALHEDLRRQCRKDPTFSRTTLLDWDSGGDPSALVHEILELIARARD